MAAYIWDAIHDRHTGSPKKLRAFYNEIDEVCKKHGLSINSEGAFFIEEYKKENIMDLRHASLYVKL